MEVMVVGAAFVGSVAAAFALQKAVLGAMFRTLDRRRTTKPYLVSQFSEQRQGDYAEISMERTIGA